MRGDLPTGTVTFLFTDIEGSTRLLRSLGAAAYADALAAHRTAIRAAAARHDGVEVDTQGDAFFLAFATATAAAEAATDAQDALRQGPVAVRMGLHSGSPTVTPEGYVGEDVHRAARVASLAHGGQVLLTEATRVLLPEATPLVDLGLHRLKDFDTAAHLFQLGTASYPPLRTPGVIDLPSPTTRFVGREHELHDAVAAWLDHEPRILTVLGAGGTGKTRFAIELARVLAEEAEGGTVFVPLATARDATLVVPTIASRLGAAVATPDGIAARIGGRRTHVVLDNVEHLLPDVASALAELVATAPTVRLVVTSREPLRVRGEIEFELDPLDAGDAVTLFLERARAVRPDVERTAAIDELCARLDRLPLALELAAARTKLLSPDQLLDRIGSALDLLRGSRDAESRHATLRTTIAWSYDLLDETERSAFAALSVFRGGWTIESAEEVCDVDLDTIASLLDKSLVRRRVDPAGERLWMLETIREFARERLAEDAGLEQTMRGRHAERCLAIARSAGLSAERQGYGLPDFALVHAELDEIRAAIDWALDADPVLGTEIVTELEQLWVSSQLAEGERVCETLLASSTALPPLLRARLLRASGGVLILRGQVELGTRRYREASEIFEQLGDTLNVTLLAARFAVHAGWDSDPDEARRMIADVRRLNAEHPNAVVEAQLLSASGDLARREGDLDAALELYARSVDVSAECGFRFWELAQLYALADLQLHVGLCGEAIETAERGLRLTIELHHDREMRWLAMILARAHLDDHPASAGLIWGALIEAEREEPLASLDAAYDEEIAELAACTSSAFSDGVARGRTMPLAQALAEAQTVP